MRPLKLTMYGFESYAEETVIDFEKFDKSDLFLITGETGSGKTTIFDAIKYALYGKTSGAERGSELISRSMRDALYSGELSTKNAPFVELVFEVNSIRYRVKRYIPFNVSSGIKKEKKDKEKNDYELISEDGSVSLTKVTSINDKIAEILGVNADQFSHVAMIAQGEFKKLIDAKDKERGDILKEIFNTGLFQKFETTLKYIFDEKEKEKTNLETTLKTLITGLKSFDGNSHGEALSEAVQSEDRFNLVPPVLEAFIQEDEKSKENIEQQQAENDENLAKLTEKQTSLETRKTLALEIKKLQKEIKDLEDEKVKIEATKKELVEKKPEIEKIKKEITLIESKLSDYTKLSNLEEKINVLSAKMEDLSEKKKKSEEEASKKKQRREEVKNDLESIGDVSVERSEVKNKREKLAKLYEDVKDFEKRFNEYEKTSRELQTAQEDARNLIVKAEGLSEIARKKRSGYLKEQAGILASTLEEGKPCPVCGSVHHEHLAELSENAPTKEEVEIAEKEAEKAQENATKASNDANKLKGTYDQQLKSIRKMALEFLEDDSLDDIALKIQKKLAEIKGEGIDAKSKLDELEGKMLKKKALSDELDSLDEQIPNLEKETSGYNASIESKKSKKSSYEEQVSGLKLGLQYETEEQARNELDSKQSIVENYDKDVEKNTKAYNKVIYSISGKNGELTAKTEELEKIPEMDEEELQKDLLECNAEKERLAKVYATLHSRIDSYKGQLASIKKELKKYEVSKKEFSQAKTMYELSHGDGRKKAVSFENYILAYYFKKIIAFANERFTEMTDNQYNLEIPDNGSLVLKVHDNYNCTTRDASSLSGGEKFKAALCLAFGFSDVMGGTGKLESLFIDEGFGSLDDSSLRSVLKVLMRTAGNNRLIGIISHVDEMKNTIEKKIVVTKENGNSKADLVIS